MKILWQKEYKELLEKAALADKYEPYYDYYQALPAAEQRKQVIASLREDIAEQEAAQRIDEGASWGGEIGMAIHLDKQGRAKWIAKAKQRLKTLEEVA